MTAIEQFNSDPSVNLYIISAYKTELSKDVNEARNEKLLHKIKFLGKIEASHGWWEGTPEESFVIISRSDLSKILLGLINDPDIDQDAYLVKPIGSVRAHNVYKDGSTEDLGTFERLTPEQAVNVNFKSQPHGVTDWFWRYTKVPITPTKSENKIVTEKMGVTKKNVTEFTKMVADAYDAAPVHDPAADPHWRALNESNRKLWQRLLSKIKIIFTTESGSTEPITIDGKSYEVVQMEDPYATQAEMKADVTANKRLYISKDHSDHPLFSVEDNIIFRTVHDYIVHILGNKPFGAYGELQAYNLHAKLVPEQAKAAIFTEVVGQVSWQNIHGSFPVQKVAVLKGFDYDEVGKVIDANVTSENTITETANASTWSDLATMFNVPSKGGRLKLSDFDHLVSKGVAIKEVAIVLANSMLKHLNATWNTIGNDNVDISTYLKPNYPTVRDMLADVKDACLDKINSDMPDEYIDTI